MKTILLLGGYGFLGTNILKYIDDRFKNEFRCVVFDKYPNHPHGLRFRCIHKVYSGDFCDKELLFKIFNENPIDIVLHVLSTTIPTSVSNARFDIETNLLPTIDVLELMVQFRVSSVVYISSGGAIYGKSNFHPHKESDDVFPLSSYGVVKLSIEKYMMLYAEHYDIKPLILRLSNPYGPFHYGMRQGVINVAFTKALQHQVMQIWGDGNGKKDYIYVDDFVDILFRLISRKIENEVVNIGSGQLLTVNQIVSNVASYVSDFCWEYKEAFQNDLSHFELNTSKLRSIIGEFSYTSIEEGLKKTYEWTRQMLLTI